MPVIAIFTLVLLGLLLAISYIDSKEMRIPDMLSVMLLAGGMTFWIVTAPENLSAQIFGGVGTAAALWLIRIGHTRLTRRIGLGLGDVKMAGAGAVWINPLLLPFFVFSASASGILYALLVAKPDKGGRLPFAPFLAIGLLSCWMTEHFL